MKRFLSVWKIVFALLLILASAFFVKTADTTASCTVEILSSTVPMSVLRNAAIRSGPGKGHAIIGIARRGQILRSTVDVGDWSIIRYDGKDAYIYKEYVKELTDQALAEGYVRAKADMDVFNGPSSYAKVLGLAQRDQVFPLRNESNDWYEIEYYGTIGLVSKLYFESLGTGETAKQPTQSETPSGKNQTSGNVQESGGTAALPTDIYVPVEGTQYVEATSFTYVRSGPSEDKSDLGKLYNGSIVVKLGTIGDWVCVEYNHRIGYVPSKHVKDSDYSPDKAVTQDQYAAAAQMLITLMNENRKNNGFAELEVSKVLMDAAKIRVEEITRIYSHTRPDGSMCNSIAPNDIFGENIARGTALPTPEAAAKGFMSSDAHKTNAMDTRHTKTGAACINVNGELFWVQLFGK